MSVPALLVSVRSLQEAVAAVAGGCDLLDVKDPDHGPLGMADASVISEIASYSETAGPARQPVPCSVALGEIDDWIAGDSPVALPPGIRYVKVGPARLVNRQTWKQSWNRVRETFARSPSSLGSSLGWVAVAYADWQAARAIAPEVVLESAIESDCDALLIDTCVKDGRTLVDVLGIRELMRLAERARDARLIFAVAGSLRRDLLPLLVEVRPDVIAVRGAACEGGRTNSISAERVLGLKREIAAVFQDSADTRVNAIGALAR